MTVYTILHATGQVDVEAEEIAFDSDGDLYLYPDSGESDPVAVFPSSSFFGVMEADAGTVHED